MASITGLNDDIISSAALKSFVDSLHPLSAFSVNYNAEAARKGEVVSIPLISSITASTFNNTYEGADGDVTLTAREVTIDKHFLSTVDFTDTQWAKSSALTPQMLADIGAEQGRAVAQAARTIVDPVSGIGLGYRRHYNTANGTHFLNFEVVGGYTYGVTGGLKILAKKA
jgi:hypothetical protein